MYVAYTDFADQDSESGWNNTKKRGEFVVEGFCSWRKDFVVEGYQDPEQQRVPFPSVRE